MSWVQVKSPNLNVQTSLGMCLKYVQDAFGSGWAGSYALQGWHQIVKKKHANRNIPSGVYVPIWFEGYWNGVNYGHVAIYKDGVCWSSPYTNKRTHDRLGSIAEVERIYGMKFIGWSEDIGGTRVVEENKATGGTPMWKDTQRHYDIVSQTFDDSTGRSARTGKKLTRAEFRASFVGKPMDESLVTIHTSPEKATWRKLGVLGLKAENDKWATQIANLKKQVADLGKRPTQAQLDAANAAVGKLSAQMKDAQAEATQARKDAAESAKQLEKIQTETEQAEKEASNFLTALINAVRKMFGK